MTFRSIQDRWYVIDPVTGRRRPSARHGRGLRYRARYRDAAGNEVTKAFPDKEKSKAQRWLDEVTASQVTGTYVDPKSARTTVAEWCETWLSGYATRRARTVRQAQVHVAQIEAAFGSLPLAAVRPSSVRSWTAELKAAGLADSYVYALHSRLSQIMSDAVHDGLLGRNPCSRRTSPGAGGQRPYVATTEQVWALHEAITDHLQPAILLGAFVGLRTAEVVGLRVEDATSPGASSGRCSSARGSRSRATRLVRRCRSRRSWPWSCLLPWPGGAGTTWCPMAQAGRPRRGPSNERSGRLGRRSPDYRRDSGSTTSATTWRHC